MACTITFWLPVQRQIQPLQIHTELWVAFPRCICTGTLVCLLMNDLGKPTGPQVQRYSCVVEKKELMNLDKSGDTLGKASCKAAEEFGLNVRRNAAEKVV